MRAAQHRNTPGSRLWGWRQPSRSSTERAGRPSPNAASRDAPSSCKRMSPRPSSTDVPQRLAHKRHRRKFIYDATCLGPRGSACSRTKPGTQISPRLPPSRHSPAPRADTSRSCGCCGFPARSSSPGSLWDGTPAMEIRGSGRGRENDIAKLPTETMKAAAAPSPAAFVLPAGPRRRAPSPAVQHRHQVGRSERGEVITGSPKQQPVMGQPCLLDSSQTPSPCRVSSKEGQGFTDKCSTRRLRDLPGVTQGVCGRVSNKLGSLESQPDALMTAPPSSSGLTLSLNRSW